MKKIIITFKEPVLDSISVYAASSSNPGYLTVRCVYTRTRKELFRHDVGYGTNNIGEFIALGMAIIFHSDLQLPIYSNSVVAIKWITETRKAMTALKYRQKNPQIFTYIQKTEKWLCNNEIGATIIKWNKKEWGKIPAHFVFKKTYKYKITTSRYFMLRQNFPNLWGENPADFGSKK